MKLRVNKKAILPNLMIILILAYSIMPFVSRLISSFFTTYFYMLILMIMLVYILFAGKKWTFNRSIVILTPFIIWRLLELVITQETVIIWGYQSLIGLMPVLLGGYILEYRKYERRLFCKLIYLAFIITIFTTIVGLIQYPEAARWLAAVESSENEMLIMYDWKNMGGYEFVYSIVLLYPLVILAYKQKKIKRGLGVGLSVGIFVFLVLAEYTTALLLFLITSILFFVKRELRGNDLIGLVFLALILCLLFSDVISNFLVWLGDIMNSDTVSHRLYALAGGKTGLENADTKRLELYMKSINTFLDYPLFGTCLRGGGGIGGHSFIFDMLAHFGIVGAVTLCFMYKQVYKVYFKTMKNKQGYGYVLWIFLQTIILSCVNTGMWLYVLTLYVPLLVREIYEKR